MIENLLYLAITIGCIFIVNSVDTKLLNTGLKKAIAGSTLSIGSGTYLTNYTNFLTFMDASSKGLFGWQGYLFLTAFTLVILVWAQNLIKYRQAIM